MTASGLVVAPQKYRVFTLHDATAYNATTALLKGTTQVIPDFNVVWVWFAPTGSYDGTVTFEISPDGGTTWFGAQGSTTATLATLVATVASPVAATSYLVYVPAWSNFRARMSGGTQGALSVYCRLTDFAFAKAT